MSFQLYHCAAEFLNLIGQQAFYNGRNMCNHYNEDGFNVQCYHVVFEVFCEEAIFEEPSLSVLCNRTKAASFFVLLPLRESGTSQGRTEFIAAII